MKRLSKKLLMLALAFSLLVPGLLPLAQLQAEAYQHGTYEAIEKRLHGRCQG